MIRVNAIPNTASAKAYYSHSDYLIEGQELTAQWHGKGAEMLGLSGPIRKEDFDLLCENLHPSTGKQLTAKHVANRRVGYDLTFSVPKSVSVAYALGGDERIASEVQGAVADTVALMEREMSARVRKGKADHDRRVGNMTWVGFLHHTSRPVGGYPDPQLHVHAVVFNAVYDSSEGIWKAGQFGDLKADAPYFQAAYRSFLSNRLQRLGYATRRTKDDFEVESVPGRTLKEFSRRTGQIEQKAAELDAGIKEDLGSNASLRPETKAKLGATTREPKREGQTWPMLVRAWEKRLKPGELEAITAAVVKSHRQPHEPHIDNRAALDFAIRHEYERNSVVPERQLITTALKHGVGSVTLDGLYEEVGRRKDLIRREEKGQVLVTTKAVLNEEKSILAFAIKGRGRHKPLGWRGEEPDPALSPSQQAAVKHVWTSPDRLMLIRGAAGTGKTTLTKAALTGLGVRWAILAPSAEASRGVLRRDGFDKADTLAKFLADDAMQDRVRGGLIWLDEASLAGARDLGRLCQLADQLDARVVLSGDRRQHKSVARGDVLALLEDKAGLPVAEVSEIKRQSGEYRQAVEALARGDTAAGFDRLDALGWVKEPGDETIPDRVAGDYLDAVRQGKSVLVVSPTHAQGEAITASLRQRLKAEGRSVYEKGEKKEVGILHGEERAFGTLVPLHLTQAERSAGPEDGTVAVFVRHCGRHKAGSKLAVTAENREELASCADRWSAYRPSEIALAAGDLVRVTANGKDVSGKHRLNNGAVHQVAGFTDKGDIRLANGWTLGKGFGHLSHGYVVTSHASQGRTVDRVLVAMGAESFGAAGREQFYVSVSRGRQQATVYSDDKEALKDAVHKDDTRLLASDLVRQPRNKLMHRLKRTIALLRQALSRDHGREPERQPERGIEMER